MKDSENIRKKSGGGKVLFLQLVVNTFSTTENKIIKVTAKYRNTTKNDRQRKANCSVPQYAEIARLN